MFKTSCFKFACFLASFSLQYCHARPRFLYLVPNTSNAARDMIALMLLHSWFTLLLMGVCCTSWSSRVWNRCHVISSWSRCTLKVCVGHWCSMSYTMLVTYPWNILITKLSQARNNLDRVFPWILIKRNLFKQKMFETKFHEFGQHIIFKKPNVIASGSNFWKKTQNSKFVCCSVQDTCNCNNVTWSHRITCWKENKSMETGHIMMSWAPQTYKTLI